MARKRVALLLFDDEPRKPRKAPPPAPPKPAPKAPARPAEPRKAPGRGKVAPPPAKAPAPVQKKIDPKPAKAPPVDLMAAVNGPPPPPGTRGAKGPVPPVPDLPPRPPTPGTEVVTFKGGRMEIQYKCRVHVRHDTRAGEIVIEEYKVSYPEIEDPKPPPAKVQTAEAQKIEKPKTKPKKRRKA